MKDKVETGPSGRCHTARNHRGRVTKSDNSNLGFIKAAVWTCSLSSCQVLTLSQTSPSPTPVVSDSVHHHFSSGFLQQLSNGMPCFFPSCSPQFHSEFSETNKSDQCAPLLNNPSCRQGGSAPLSLPTLFPFLPPIFSFSNQDSFKPFWFF